MDVLRAVEWWKDETTEVLAELVNEGLIRVYLAEEARPLVETLAQNLAGLPPDIRFERTAVLTDRYRTLTLYADGRLRFKKEVAQILGFSLGDRCQVFVQSFPKGLEILSLALRMERLRKDEESTSIGLHTTGLG